MPEVGLQDAIDVLLVLLAHLDREPQQQAVVEQRDERATGVRLRPVGQGLHLLRVVAGR